jgi:AraC-like DNA-binding protein
MQRAPGQEHIEVHAAPPRLRNVAPCLVLRRIAQREPVTATVQATTFACLNVVVHGHVEVDGQLQPSTFLAGPLARPRATRAHGLLASASLVLAPWAIEPWMGLRIDTLADRLVPPGLTRPDANVALCDALAAACGDVRAIPGVWTAVDDAARVRPASEPRLAIEVLTADGVDAAAAAIGVSGRQYRRRFERALGLTPAAWLRVRRWEGSLQALLAPDSVAALAAVAADLGYADQAHLARDTRAFVHGTPARLRSAAAQGAAAWSLAPARVRILQDEDPRAP